MLERDNLHFTFREIDGYQKLYNIVICEREVGKTTSLELDKIIFPFLKDNRTSCYLVRKSIEITEDLIESIETRINRFMKDKIEFIYSKKEFKDGCVSIYAYKNKEKKLIFKIVSLGMELQRLKKITIDNIHAIIFDEAICNPRLNEKYVKGEALKLKEFYNTLRRFEYKEKGLRIYICGNPYSKYNPVLMDLGVDTNKMKQGARIVGENYIVECYRMKDELREKILKANPLYQFDNTYKEYAFDGQYLNDTHIRIDKLPNHYFLKFVFNMNGVYLGIYKNDYLQDMTDKYFVKKINFSEVRKSSYCFDFNDLVNGSVLMSNEERTLFSHLKQAIRNRSIAFESVDCYYLIEEIYKQL